MIAALRSEFRKLLTVRSTYAIVIICLLIICLFAGFGDGYKANPAALQSPNLLMGESSSAIVFVGLIVAFVGLLLAAHEYRYNTIMYTLTINNSRLKVMLTKFLAISVFAILISVVFALFSPLCTIIGTHLHGYSIAPQHFYYWTTLWHCCFVGWGYAMFAFILIMILRNQVGSIVTFLLIPLIGESIIGHIFTKSTNYLPFTMLQAVSDAGRQVTTSHAVTVSLVYIAAGLVISAGLFLKRDAN